MLKARNVLMFLAYKYNGNWDKMYEAIRTREPITAKEVEKLECDKIKAITIVDDNYPEGLKQQTKPPLVLFYKGDLSLLTNERKIFVAGSEKPSGYGARCTELFIKRLIERNFTNVIISSEGSNNIDYNIRKYNGKRIMVCHRGISNYISFDKLLLLSEFPEDFVGSRESAVRIATAISNESLFIESSNKEPLTDLEVALTLNLGKDVYCVPSKIGERNSYNNHLIQNGAFVFCDPDDIDEYLLTK